MLLRTRELIVVIAVACGYEEATNFARAFRAYAGCSPTAFREANTGADDDCDD